MPESFESRLLRWKFNLFPAYRGSGGRIDYMSADFREIRIHLDLSWRTRNYVGTIFGGSLYACVDPVYMIMLIKILGPAYVVWDKAATIRFKRPGRSRLSARFEIPEEETAAIKKELDTRDSIDRIYEVSLVDGDGVVHATVEKVIYMARKDRVRSKNP